MPSRRDHQAITAFPIFPVEILSEIFSHLDPSSVRRVLCVNSLFRSLARPLAYQYGTVTDLGLFFPGAQHAYPFSQGFMPGLPVSELSKESMGVILRQLKRIDVKQYPHQDCKALFIPVQNPKSSFSRRSTSYPELDVLNLAVQSCPPEQRILRNPQPGDDDVDMVPLCPCILEVLGSHWSTGSKLVAKDILRQPGDFEYSHTRSTDTIDTHISVVYSQTSPCAPEILHDYVNPVRVARELCIGDFRHLEVVFWTERPGQAWIPRCKYSTERGRTGTCLQTEGTIWSALAEQIAPFAPHCITSVTIVNSAAILPAASTIVEHELEVNTNQARLQEQHAWCFDEELKLQALYCGRGPGRDSTPETFEFITMEEWIRRGGWEDVFTLEEIGPWLAKAEASTGNSLPSIVHVYSLKELAGLSL
ncbi:hypothetical protein A1Q1_05793 [Trichosporon asahii var. asahii CBS 2479]|uniref:F-box domain-containing protein n=1 Tax=Trichosporon asahii var. asahii (strain ATCC 90039 / CBS 2479 / JCM 2466 / KCTC 7840 / NBRC 103889/ NCYC 2677 / UAMH 7654) TaxID=1186058 RepID=J6EMU9_TRIAS|nr:hypothetical protein A1Q1_05793 [Trichosporon asahii var. asahii CBS 2479]EJT45644.1 hypothetical protein A1Q1_05793 [Trichosporon asahii var. asahii CBS 2479]